MCVGIVHDRESYGDKGEKYINIPMIGVTVDIGKCTLKTDNVARDTRQLQALC